MNQIRLLAKCWMFAVTDFPFSERTKNLTGHVLDLVVTCSVLQSLLILWQAAAGLHN